MVRLFSVYLTINLFLSYYQLPDGVMSDALNNLISSAPHLAIIAALFVYLSRMQREEREEQRRHLEHMIDKQAEREDRLADQIDELAKQLAVNSAVVAEASNVDAVLGALLDRAFPNERDNRHVR